MTAVRCLFCFRILWIFLQGFVNSNFTCSVASILCSCCPLPINGSSRFDLSLVGGDIDTATKELRLDVGLLPLCFSEAIFVQKFGPSRLLGPGWLVVLCTLWYRNLGWLLVTAGVESSSAPLWFWEAKFFKNILVVFALVRFSCCWWPALLARCFNLSGIMRLNFVNFFSSSSISLRCSSKFFSDRSCSGWLIGLDEDQYRPWALCSIFDSPVCLFSETSSCGWNSRCSLGTVEAKRTSLHRWKVVSNEGRGEISTSALVTFERMVILSSGTSFLLSPGLSNLLFIQPNSLRVASILWE